MEVQIHTVITDENYGSKEDFTCSICKNEFKSTEDVVLKKTGGYVVLYFCSGNCKDKYDYYISMLNEIMEYEGGTMSDEDTISFFQKLVDTKLAWQLQEHYSRTANELIESGDIRGHTKNDLFILLFLHLELDKHTNICYTLYNSKVRVIKQGV